MNLDNLKEKLAEMYQNSPWLSRMLLLFGFLFSAFVVYKLYGFWRKPKTKKPNSDSEIVLDELKEKEQLNGEEQQPNSANSQSATDAKTEPAKEPDAPKDAPATNTPAPTEPVAAKVVENTPPTPSNASNEAPMEDEEDEIDLQATYNELIVGGRTPSKEELEAFVYLYDTAPKHQKKQFGHLKGAANLRLRTIENNAAK